MPKGMETEQWGVYMMLEQQKIIIAGLTIPYFLAKQ